MALSYTSTSNIKLALGIATLAGGGADTVDDALLDTYASEANTWLEGRIGYPVGPSQTSTTRFFDASAVGGGGRYLRVPGGIRSVNAIACAAGTGGAYYSVPSSDYFLRPYDHERDSGWPATRIEVTDSPSSVNEWGSVFPTTGYRVIQVTGSWGFDAIPSDLAQLATRLAVSAFRARAYGTGSEYVVGEDGERVFEREMSARDWGTVKFYRELRI